MKFLPAFCLMLLTASMAFGQAEEATLLFNWQNDDITPTGWLGGRYNDTWGVEINDREIAIIGSTAGVHFFDVTEGTDAVELPDAFVAGAADGSNLLHRDYHSYGDYLYTVADEGVSTLQVIDMSELPTSVNVVYDANDLMVRAHNIFIDTTSARLYACGVSQGPANYALRILSLDDPENPTLVASFPNASLSLPYVHDTYVQGDTAYLNCGPSGFYVVDFSDPENPELLGTMTDYEQQGYNHSGWLHPNGQYYYLADETHGTDLKVVDVSNFSDIHVVKTFGAESGHPSEIAHNLIVHEGKLYVSYYYDGLQVFDLTDPADPQRMAYYDTYEPANDASYKGAWGVYPFLSSGNVLLSDMHNGLFLFEKVEDFTPVATEEVSGNISQMTVFPNPTGTSASLQLSLNEASEDVQIRILDTQGRVVKNLGEQNLISGKQLLDLDVSDLPTGMFQVMIISRNSINSTALVIQR
ncbi:MAG: choice-of-anchor B family protein [Bacteroidetes bacterium]|nr:choice-of-anchor B family protein [Bacteroidota bacterium]